MRRTTSLLGVAVAGALTVASGGAAAGALAGAPHGAAPSVSMATHVDATGARRARGHRRAGARMLVYAQEWSLWPSRTSLPGGRVVVQLWNRGQDAHNVRIRRVNRSGAMFGQVQRMPLTLSGGISQASWTLRPGLYELYCSMPGHLARGMHVFVQVR